MASHVKNQGGAALRHGPRAALVLLLAGAVGCAGGRDSSQGNIYGGSSRVIKLDASAERQGAGESGGAGGGTTDAGSEASGPSAACTTCEKEECTTDDFIHDNLYSISANDPDQPPSADSDLYDLCYPRDPSSKHATDMPIAGPAAGSGVTKAELCREVISCVRSTGCSFLSNSVECYCGTQSAIDCAKPNLANGPCKNVFESAAETSSPLEVVNRRFDLPGVGSMGYALAYAVTFLGACETRPPNFMSGDWDPPCASACASDADAGTAGADAEGAGGSVGASGGGPGAGGAGGTNGAAGTGGTGSGGDGSACVVTHSLGAGCATCVLGASSATKCMDPTLFSAKSTTDDDGNAQPDGFGPDTLPTKAQQDAAYALIERVKTLLPGSVRNAPNTQNATPGSDDANVQNGLLKLGASNTAFTFGATDQFLPAAMSALNEYKAAAAADASGPRGVGIPPGLAGSPTDADIASYISAWATQPKSALGLVDDILMCAVNAEVDDPRCMDCFNVTTTTDCGRADAGADSGGEVAGTTGAAGATGAAGTTGAAGAAGAAGTTGVAGAAGAAGTTGVAGAAGTAGTTGVAGTGGSGASLMKNASFDDATTNWTADPSSTATWTSRDGDGNAASGAIAVTNLDTNPLHATNGWTTAGASQCVAVTSDAAARTYQITVQAYVPGGQGSGAAQLILGYSLSGSCGDKPFALSFFSPLATTTNSWQTISGTTTQIPDGVQSVSVRLVAFKPVAQPSLEVLFDNVVVRVR